MTREELEKEFPVGDSGYTIARIDYESMPCSMMASWFSDEDMTNLAFEISRFFEPTGEDKEADDDEFWEMMERCAVHMGMKYYEDVYEKWLEAFQDLPVETQVCIFNQVVSSTEEIHAMDDFDDIIHEFEMTPFDVLIRACGNGDNIDHCDTWWKFDKNGHFQTMDDDSVLDEIEPYYEKIFDNEEYWCDDINIKEL